VFAFISVLNIFLGLFPLFDNFVGRPKWFEKKEKSFEKCALEVNLASISVSVFSIFSRQVKITGPHQTEPTSRSAC
jgi:hypothetical protein